MGKSTKRLFYIAFLIISEIFIFYLLFTLLFSSLFSSLFSAKIWKSLGGILDNLISFPDALISGWFNIRVVFISSGLITFPVIM